MAGLTHKGTAFVFLWVYEDSRTADLCLSSLLLSLSSLCLSCLSCLALSRPPPLSHFPSLCLSSLSPTSMTHSPSPPLLPPCTLPCSSSLLSLSLSLSLLASLSLRSVLLCSRWSLSVVWCAESELLGVSRGVCSVSVALCAVTAS